MSYEDNQLIFQCFECKRNYVKVFNIKLIRRFRNTYELCNGDINKFILLLRKRVYPYEYMDIFLQRIKFRIYTDKDYSHA